MVAWAAGARRGRWPPPSSAHTVGHPYAWSPGLRAHGVDVGRRLHRPTRSATRMHGRLGCGRTAWTLAAAFIGPHGRPPVCMVAWAAGARRGRWPPPSSAHTVGHPYAWS